jgi:hypothetical protein
MEIVVSEVELQGIIETEFYLAGEGTPTLEELGRLLAIRADPDAIYATPPEYWRQLKQEFRLFLCTKDKKYATLRRELGEKGKRSQTFVISALSAAMAHSLGVAAGVLTPSVRFACSLSLSLEPKPTAVRNPSILQFAESFFGST